MSGSVAKRTRQLMGGDGQAAYGCIVSFETERGDELTLHRDGALVPALRAACAAALAVDPGFRVVAYSTPQTVYDDLQGRGMTFERQGHSIAPVRPENYVLARAGLDHMAHPRLRLYATDSERKRRYRKERSAS